MVTVINNSITLVRGDTVEIPITIRTREGDIYEPSEGDAIRFALKENYNSDAVLVKKVLPNDDLTLRLDACETKALEAKKKPYVYDVELTAENGYVDTFVRGLMVVLEEVC